MNKQQQLTQLAAKTFGTHHDIYNTRTFNRVWRGWYRKAQWSESSFGWWAEFSTASGHDQTWLGSTAAEATETLKDWMNEQ